MAFTLSDIDAVLEELYLSDSAIPDQIMRENPALAMLPNKTTGGGKYRHVHVKTVRPQGRSVAFATAQTNASGSQRVAFDVTWADNYQVVELDGNVIRDPQANKTMLINHVKDEMDGAIDNLKDDIAHQVFRNGGGARGQENGTWTTPSDTVTLADPEDIAHFEIGMVVKAATTDGTSGSVKAGSLTIESLDRDAGSITFTAAADTGIATFAQNDFLFVDGDFGAKMTGFEAWIPASAPGATAFFGVDRSTDPVRLGGVRYDGSSGTIAAAAVNLAARIRRWKKGAKLDIGIINPIQMAVLELALEGRKEVVEVEGKGAAAGLGFRAINLASSTNGGQVSIIADPNCQADTLWLLNTDSWCYETVGEMVRIINEDGNRILRKASTDAFEGRLHSRGNIWCNEPGSNGRATLAAA